MAKHLKRFNKTTGEWEIISSPDVNINATLEDGSSIKDTNVIITNYNYVDDAETGKTLDDTLTDISDDISKLQRNVSWLAEHGGNGGSGNGGSILGGYGIVIETPILESGATYVNSDKVQVTFRITGGTDGDYCKYSYEYDNNRSGDQDTPVNTTVTLTFDNTNSTLTRHTLTIRATNPYNNTISPKSFYIYKSSFTIVNNTDSSVLNSYIKFTQGIYNVSYNYIKNAYIPFLIQCGMMNAQITLSASRDGTETTPVKFIWDNETTEQYKKNISLSKIIGNSLIIGTTYAITFEAQALYGVNLVKVDKFKASVKIINPDELTITLSVDGTSASSDYIDIAEGSNFTYSCTFLGPANIKTVNYAVKLQKEGEDAELIYGKYYDDTLKNDDTTSYTSNPFIQIGEGRGQNYTLSSSYRKNDKLTLSIKAWSWDGEYTAEAFAKLLIGAPSTNIFPRQYPEGSLLMSFNNSYNVKDNNQIWESKQNYEFINSKYSGDISYFVMNVLNSNGENSGIFTEETTELQSLRLQNKAYATVDVSEFSGETSFISGNAARGENPGFVVSFTYSYDKSSTTDHTVFLWGENQSESNTIANGFRIDCNKATWAYTAENGTRGSIFCNVPSGVKTTVDFVYNKSVEMILIYVNGMPNAAQDLTALDGLSETQTLPNTIYIGCNLYNGITNYSDMNVYDFSVYTSHLNDLSININSKNARLNGSSSNEDVIADYNTWKAKNFIYTEENDLSTPLCHLIDNATHEIQQEFDGSMLEKIALESNIPTLALNLKSDFFTKSFFYQSQGSNSSAKAKCDADATYYTESGTTCSFKAQVALQGTSTMNYKVKNLELYIAEDYTDEYGSTKKFLFQPKPEWMPENEFTLKADVVDSAHANNTCIGEWINKSGLFEPTPPMKVFDANRPKDINMQGEVCTTYRNDGTTIDFHKDVTLKHTLEGFPILLFLSFPGSGEYTLMGIYSFNLGRNSYYNMGMKFLRSFCRRDENGNELSCPALIKRYEEMETLGDLKAGDVYNYEFTQNDVSTDHPLWTQFDPTMLRYWGEMKYPEDGVDNNSQIWTRLSELFEVVAKSPTGSYYDEFKTSYTGFTSIYPYIYLEDTKEIVQDGSQEISQSEDNYEQVGKHIDINNANAYFVICNAFGMTDSLGKNMELKTWDGGKKWYPSFYDMDTALGLSNEGSENIPVTCFIDTYSTVTDDTNRQTNTYVAYHDNDKTKATYAAYPAKLWGLLRDREYIYATLHSKDIYPYEEIWGNIRKGNASNELLKNTNTFAETISKKVFTCGELIYCLDYYSKYINKENDSNADSALSFLHGNRVEFIRDWLKKHAYFLDGVFDAKTRVSGYTSTESDTPFYNDSMTWAFWYQNNHASIPITLRVSTPTFIILNTNTTNPCKYYIGDANTDFKIFYSNETAVNSQTIMYGTSLITKFSLFKNSGYSKINEFYNGFCNLEELDLSDNNRLSDENPLKDPTLRPFNNGNSPMETLNLNNAKCINQTKISFPVSLSSGFNKLLNIDISYSDVTSLVLPSSTLETLNVKYSRISDIEVKNQSKLTTVDVEGCTALTTASISNCENIKNLTFSGLSELSSVSVTSCKTLETILISNNKNLQKINIDSCTGLTEIVIDKCIHTGLTISITNCGSINTINITNITSGNIITLPAKDTLTGVTTISFMGDTKLTGLQYDGSDAETVNGANVFDISPFTNLETYNLYNMSALEYLRVANNKKKPFVVDNTTFMRCNNLIRVFGHISITGNQPFSGKNNFYLNDSVADVDGVTPFNEPQWSDSTGATNVSIKTDNLSDCFSGTRCNLSDVYYILQKCDNSYSFTEEGDTVVTDLSGTFRRCTGITTSDENSLNEDLFKHCGNVVNIDYLFEECGIKGYLSNKLLSNLPLLENFDSVFYTYSDSQTGAYKITGDEGKNIFFPEGCNIKMIRRFNPTSDSLYNDGGLLKNLKSLESIEDSFNGLGIRFSESGSLFENNPCLTNITKSFNNISGMFVSEATGDEAITDVFGATALVSVKDSFTFSGNRETPYIFMGNSFFDKIKGSLEEWDNVFNATEAYGVTTSHKHINPNDTDGKNFPYKILSGCTKLKSAIGMFRGLNPINEDDVIAITPEILSGCTSLTNFSYGFAEMNFKYTLSSNIFENCQITNMSYVFSDKSGYGKVGRIPYHLFYQKAGNIITDMSYAMSNGGALMISGSTLCGCLPYSATTEEMEQYGVEDGAWNPYIYDGSANFLSNLTGTTVYQEHKDLELPELFKDKQRTTLTAVQSATATTDGNLFFDADATVKSQQRTEAQIFYSTIINGEYFCPADIFKYCVSNATVNSCFAKAGCNDTHDGKFYGMFGAVPALLLQPITGATSLYGLFNGFSTITPSVFPSVEKTGNIVYGTMMPDGLFDNLTRVTDVSSMFAGIYSCGKCQWNSSMFDSFATSLAKAADLFNYSVWKTSELLLPYDFFIKCTRLEDISRMFRNAQIYSSSDWMADSIAVNCVTMEFMYGARVYGKVPAFWDHDNFNNADHTDCFYGISSDTCENYVDIPSWWR